MTSSDLAGLLADHAARSSVPGAVVAVVDGDDVECAATGVADVTTGVAVTPETRFAIGSVTKSMVATVVVGLAAEGRLGLDDPVSEHLPELRGDRWAAAASVRDLLANTSRVPLRSAWEFDLDGGGPDVLSRCASLVAGQEPGPSVWSYSNLGWCLLGRLIETVTGLAWEVAMRERLLAPAEMEGTTFAACPLAEPRATGHESGPQGPVPVAAWTPRAYCSAGSSLLATAPDLARFGTWTLADPEHDVLRETHADAAIHGWLDGWGLGWGRFDWPGETVWGWDGLVPGQRVMLRVVPQRRVAVALAANGARGRELGRSLFRDLLEERFGVGPPPLRLDPSPGAAGDLDRFTGVYAWPDRTCEVTATADRLWLESNGRRREALPVTERAFLVDVADPDNPTVTFAADGADGRPEGIYLMLWGLPRA